MNKIQKNLTFSLRWWQLLGESLYATTERTGRTIFSIVSVAIGIAAIVTTIGFASSAGTGVLLRLDSLNSRVVVIQVNHDSPNFQRTLTKIDVSRIQNISQVEAVGAYSIIDSDISVSLFSTKVASMATRKMVLYGGTLNLYSACECQMVSGRWFKNDELLKEKQVAILGYDTASMLGISRSGVGRNIFIKGVPYQLIGIIARNENVPIGNGVILPQNLVEKQWKKVGLEAILVLSSSNAVQIIGEALIAMLDSNKTGSIEILSPSDYKAVNKRIESDINGLYLVLGCVSLLVGGIGIANTRLMSVMERLREIGLRRALGAKRRSILAQFLLESGILGILGGILGTSLGIIVVVVGAIAQGWPPTLHLIVVLAGPIVGLIIGCLAGAYSAIRAARVEPVEALRETL